MSIRPESPPAVWMLPALASSVTAARHQAADLIKRHLSQTQAQAFLLALTEVVTNAVRHGAPEGSEIRVAITPKDGYMCVQVTDAGQGFVPSPRAMQTSDEGGFGLFLVERLTRRWGVTRELGHTRVWFELDFQAP